MLTKSCDVCSWCHISLFIGFHSILSSHCPGLGWEFLFYFQLHKDPGDILNAGAHGKNLESSGCCGHRCNIIDQALVILLFPHSWVPCDAGIPCTLGPTSLAVPQSHSSGTLLPPGAATTLRTGCLHYPPSWRNCLFLSPSGLCIPSAISSRILPP